VLLGWTLDRHRTFAVIAGCFLWAAVWIVVTAEAARPCRC
jgi:hypothetical protein